jgi:glycogen operon protein
MLLGGEAVGEVDEKGEPLRDETLLPLLNGHHEPVEFALPASSEIARWEVVLNTSVPEDIASASVLAQAGHLELSARSLVLLRALRDKAEE